VQNIARSLQRVVPSHLGDSALFDFAALRPASDSELGLVDLTFPGSPTPGN
jgi:hypothetical protein